MDKQKSDNLNLVRQFLEDSNGLALRSDGELEMIGLDEVTGNISYQPGNPKDPGQAFATSIPLDRVVKVERQGSKLVVTYHNIAGTQEQERTFTLAKDQDLEPPVEGPAEPPVEPPAKRAKPVKGATRK